MGLLGAAPVHWYTIATEAAHVRFMLRDESYEMYDAWLVRKTPHAFYVDDVNGEILSPNQQPTDVVIVEQMVRQASRRQMLYAVYGIMQMIFVVTCVAYVLGETYDLATGLIVSAIVAVCLVGVAAIVRRSHRRIQATRRSGRRIIESLSGNE